MGWAARDASLTHGMSVRSTVRETAESQTGGSVAADGDLPRDTGDGLDGRSGLEVDDNRARCHLRRDDGDLWRRRRFGGWQDRDLGDGDAAERVGEQHRHVHRHGPVRSAEPQRERPAAGDGRSGADQQRQRVKADGSAGSTDIDPTGIAAVSTSASAPATARTVSVCRPQADAAGGVTASNRSSTPSGRAPQVSAVSADRSGAPVGGTVTVTTSEGAESVPSRPRSGAAATGRASLGAVAGWGVGSYFGTQATADIELTNGRVTEPDMADQWSAIANRRDLAAVLDELFALANDATRPRAVIVLGGDIHLGAIHEIRSSDPAHTGCQVIWQFTSSPIGAPPASGLIDLLGQADVLEVFDPDDWFTLCATGTGLYSARITGGVGGLLPVRNFGTLVVNRLDSGRRLLVRGTIRGAPRPPVWGLQLPRPGVGPKLRPDPGGSADGADQLPHAGPSAPLTEGHSDRAQSVRPSVPTADPRLTLQTPILAGRVAQGDGFQ